MISSESVMDTAVMDEPEVVAVAGESPQSTQLGLESVEQMDCADAGGEMPPSTVSERRGIDEFLEGELQDRRSAKGEVGRLALRIAAGENVPADGIDDILGDANASAGRLRKMIAQATEVLKLVAAIDAERADAADLDTFQDATEDELLTIWRNIAAIKKHMSEAQCRVHRARCDHRARLLKTEKIAAAAAEAARALAGIDTSVYGLEVPARTPAVARDVGQMPRNIEWVDSQTNSLVARKKAEFLKLSAAGKLPPVVPIASPESMFEPERAKPAENLEPSIETAETTAEDMPSGDLDDEFGDELN